MRRSKKLVALALFAITIISVIGVSFASTKPPNKNALWEAIVDLQNRVGGLETRSDGHDADIIDLQSRAGSLESQVDTLQAAVADQQTQIDALESQVGSLETTVADQQTQINTLESELDALANRVDLLAFEKTRYLPLTIDGVESAVWNMGSEYYLTLTIHDWVEAELSITYIIFNALYVGGGTPSQMKILDEESYPGMFPITFNEVNTPDWSWSTTSPLEITSVSPGAVITVVTLIGDQNYIIGQHYFKLE